MITIPQLQNFLNNFEALRGITVTHASDIKKEIAPHVVILTGLVNILGTPHLFEAEINLMEFHTRDDLILLGGTILEAFDRAGVQKLRTT